MLHCEKHGCGLASNGSNLYCPLCEAEITRIAPPTPYQPCYAEYWRDWRDKHNLVEAELKALKTQIHQLGRESYAAVRGWWPEDFEGEEGKFTIDRAFEAIKAECELGREAHRNNQALNVVYEAAKKITDLCMHDYETIGVGPIPVAKTLDRIYEDIAKQVLETLDDL
jgi:hypothetical protein